MDGGWEMRMNSFDPGADSVAFRNALGAYPTGVTVVTCQGADGPLGITANSFASVSLDPPLVLWSPAKASTRFAAFAAAEHFAIHVLAAHQIALAKGFARSGQAFDEAEWAENEAGVPLLGGCLTRLECRRTALYDAGDHAIIIGAVARVSTTTGHPLMFHAGQLTTAL